MADPPMVVDPVLGSICVCDPPKTITYCDTPEVRIPQSVRLHTPSNFGWITPPTSPSHHRHPTINTDTSSIAGIC